MNLYYIPPRSFYIGNREIAFYGVIMAVAMLVGILLACKLCKKRGVKSDDIILLAVIMLPCAVVGARLYYCFFYEYNYSFWEIFYIGDGGIQGLAIYGGVIGGLVGIIIFCAIKRSFKILGTICDICVPCLILGQAIGRWGNFFNQEAYGNLVTNSNLQWFPFAVYIESKGAWYQATFFYESMWNLIGCGLLIFIYYKSRFTMTTSACYLVWYGLGRMVIEGLRSDSLYIGSTSIRVSQLLSAILIVVGLVILGINIYRYIKDKRNSLSNAVTPTGKVENK